MKSFFSKQVIRKTGLTLLFYLCASATFFLLEKAAPSGSCTPGLGVMSIFILPYISGILFFVNIAKVRKHDQSNLVSAIIHLVVFIIGMIFFRGVL